MSNTHDKGGVQETAAAWQPEDAPSRATIRPTPEPVEWEALLDSVERDFPKTLARLAE